MADISPQSMQRILQSHRLKPWRVHFWLSPKVARDGGVPRQRAAAESSGQATVIFAARIEGAWTYRHGPRIYGALRTPRKHPGARERRSPGKAQHRLRRRSATGGDGSHGRRDDAEPKPDTAPLNSRHRGAWVSLTARATPPVHAIRCSPQWLHLTSMLACSHARHADKGVACGADGAYRAHGSRRTARTMAYCLPHLVV